MFEQCEFYRCVFICRPPLVVSEVWEGLMRWEPTQDNEADVRRTLNPEDARGDEFEPQ